MAIATSTAILGAAAIGAGAGFLGSRSQSKGINSANKTQQQATEAQLTLGRETNALNKDIYGQNRAILDPFVQRGNVAGNQINAMLGLRATGDQTDWGGYVNANPDAMYDWRKSHSDKSIDDYGAWHWTNEGGKRDISKFQGGQNAMSGLENFANSAGMKFQMQEGANALNNLYAGNGALNSGAAMKAMQDYGQNTALNNYFMPYMNLLGGQQATGAGAASSVAGVGSNFVNTAATTNAGMGSALQTGAANRGNLMLQQGQNQANMWNNLGSSFGTALGALRTPGGAR